MAVPIPQAISLKEFAADVRKYDLRNEEKFKYGANDFAIALYDTALLNNAQRWFYYTKELNLSLHWFEVNNPFLYTYYESYFINFITYLLIVKCLSGEYYEPTEIEKYFTDQLVAFYFKKKLATEERLSNVYQVWNKASDIIIKFLDIVRASGTKTITNSFVYLRSYSTNKAIFGHSVPIVRILKKDTISIHLILTYNTKKPNWYSIPFLYKIIGYYLKLGLTVVHINLHWFDLDSTIPFVTDEVLIYDEVKDIIDRYKDISPLPYRNVFNPHGMSTYYQIKNEKEMF